TYKNSLELSSTWQRSISRSLKLPSLRNLVAVADSSAVGERPNRFEYTAAIFCGAVALLSSRSTLAASAFALCSIHGPLIISSDCVGVVVTFRSGMLLE